MVEDMESQFVRRPQSSHSDSPYFNTGLENNQLSAGCHTHELKMDPRSQWRYTRATSGVTRLVRLSYSGEQHDARLVPSCNSRIIASTPSYRATASPRRLGRELALIPLLSLPAYRDKSQDTCHKQLALVLGLPESL